MERTTMTPEQQAAFIHAQAACAMIECAGMQAANRHAELSGQHPPYGHQDFLNIMKSCLVGHNEVLTFFQG